MQKCLYLLCPTDCLETVINNRFPQENYFYTSLGNSFNSDSETIDKLKCVVQKHHIRKICFVLSYDNKIVKDALTNQDFSDINGLREFYKEISKQKEQSKVTWRNNNRKLSLLSYYLNKKIKALQLTLDNTCSYAISINGKIYDRNDKTFTTIYHDLACFKEYQLN